MELHDYVLGVHRPNGHHNFCYGIERELDGLGSFVGATAYKFGIYYGRTKSDETIRYRWRNRYGENADDAFYNVKVAIRELIKSGKNEDMLAKNREGKRGVKPTTHTFKPDGSMVENQVVIEEIKDILSHYFCLRLFLHFLWCFNYLCHQKLSPIDD
jgi:hypothetical protein